MSAPPQAPTPPRHQGSVPRRPQPVGDLKVVALRLVGGAVVLWAALSLIGVLATSVLASGWGLSWDRGGVVWMAARRTGFCNTTTMFGSGLANTQTAIAVTVVVVLFLRWRLGRWCESGIVVAAIAGELLVFLAVTATVHRPRPSVKELDAVPP